jgi:hypothetical protein
MAKTPTAWTSGRHVSIVISVEAFARIEAECQRRRAAEGSYCAIGRVVTELAMQYLPEPPGEVHAPATLVPANPYSVA